MFINVEQEEYQKFGFISSVVGHALVFLIVAVRFAGWGNFQPPVVYSVTIEGGTKLGGVSQVAKDDKKTPITPLKKVSEQEKKEKETAPVVDKKEETKIPVSEKGEVQVKKKEEQKPKEDKKPEKKEDKKKTKEDLDKEYANAMKNYLGESSNGGGQVYGAAALGGNAMGGGVVRPPEFFEYLKRLEKHIKSGWIWQDANAALVTQVVFEMSPDGRITGIQVVKGSGNPSYDDSVYRAISKASPAPPPPATVYEYFKSVRLTFDPRE